MHYDMSFVIKNNLRIITIDRPGHGFSDFNPTGSILDFAKDVMQLIKYLKIDTFSVAGMSAGSPFALGIAYLFPEKVNSASIISGFALYTRNSRKHLRKEVKVMFMFAKSLPFILKILLKIQARQMVKQPKKALNGFLKIMSEPDQEILKNESVMNIIENMFMEAFRNGSKGVSYEISNL